MYLLQKKEGKISLQSLFLDIFLDAVFIFIFLKIAKLQV